ncbi:hypothetical protein YC2023_033477 [Brassica napus]
MRRLSFLSISETFQMGCCILSLSKTRRRTFGNGRMFMHKKTKGLSRLTDPVLAIEEVLGEPMLNLESVLLDAHCCLNEFTWSIQTGRKCTKCQVLSAGSNCEGLL